MTRPSAPGSTPLSRLAGASLDVEGAELPTVRTPQSPERRLMLAVLEDAVNCIRCRPAAQDHAWHPHGKLYDDAERWFRSSAHSWPFDFENICDVLGIEADYLRRGVFTGTGKIVLGATRNGRTVAVWAPATGPGTGRHGYGVRPEAKPWGALSVVPGGVA